MTTERDEAGIWHIDGPPYRGFVIAEFPDGSGNRVEVIYRCLRYLGTKKDCEDAYNILLNLIRSELQDLSESQPNYNQLVHPIIWWRTRVEYSQDPDDQNRWRFYCRLATTPPLPNMFWEQWETKEGALSRNAREVCG